MTYTLFVGDELFSSWSLRAYLLFDRFGLPFELRHVALYGERFAADLAPVADARTVPAILTPEGDPLGDTIAIAETLAERHPEAGFWPADAAARLYARWLVAEMHAGFADLRAACPMNLGGVWEGFEPGERVRADLARIEHLWQTARDRFGQGGPWLLGRYSIADAFFAPVAARIAGYRLPVSAATQAYVAAHLADPTFRRWRARGAARHYESEPYAMHLARSPWPGPERLPAHPVPKGPAVNGACPYSGLPPSHFLELGGRIFGFCNAFCRDKTVADAAVWPAFARLAGLPDPGAFTKGAAAV